MFKNYLILILAFSFLVSSYSHAQTDDEFEDFDPSMFEEAGTTLKAFCTNKVLSQSPTQLISFSFDMQGASTLNTDVTGVQSLLQAESIPSENVDFDYSPGFRFNSNIPILSKNNILINYSLNYVQLGYMRSSDDVLSHPLTRTLSQNSLKWLNTSLTLFKPLNEKRFILLQLAAELNGDYDFNNMPDISNTRLPAAFIYGFKPSDKFIWGVGVSRTYLGGALNYIPVVYYFQTFKNDKWGVESLFPGRLNFRYRTNSRNVWMLGYNVEGATYNLSNFASNTPLLNNYSQDRQDELQDIELRRSEIRAGLNYQRGLNDFIWVGVNAGYRINYSFELDDGDFYRGFDDEDYFMENDLSDTFYFQVSLSLVSP